MAENIVAIEYEALLLGKRITRVAGFRGSRLGMLDRSAYILLVSLEDQPKSIGELSEITGLDASTLNRQTAAMRRQNIIQRIPDPDGGMARKFTLTQEGERSLAQQRKRNLGALSTVLSDWSSEEIARFAAALTRFNRAVQSLEMRNDS
ncbi:MAG: ArsR family transcriptional regulator [Bifidobacterium subtile]|uniref:MarR family winged helix-turn-helix transcriptional regulator n=1 Tax=Bifidobacterium subtile TaxID=77635 RepID=UPI002F35C4DB|nr:ArsR family transcriptional regulator [Bifidobacterium subtile]